MVLSDVTTDYEKFINLLGEQLDEDSFIGSSLRIVRDYHARITNSADCYLKSSQASSDGNTLLRSLGSLEGAFSVSLNNMNRGIRDTTRLITEIERIEFCSPTVQELAQEICDKLNELMDLINDYVTNKMLGRSNSETFFTIIDKLEEFEAVYIRVMGNYDFLQSTGEELLEKLPETMEAGDSVTLLDLRSLKPSNSLAAFSEDLALLDQCFNALERLCNVDSSSAIITQKIESGSLKGLFASDKIDFTIFPDLISSITNAIRTLRMTPVDKERVQAETRKLNAEAAVMEAEAEQKRIQNEGLKLSVAREQIDFLSEKLGINVDEHPEAKEQMEQFCLPLISYLEHNPVGAVNGVPYNLSEHVNLIEMQDRD